MVAYTIPKRRPLLRLFTTMLCATSQKRFSFFPLATRQECAEWCLASIVMYPQWSTIHLLLQFFITAVPVFQYVFCCRGPWGDIKTARNVFLKPIKLRFHWRIILAQALIKLASIMLVCLIAQRRRTMKDTLPARRTWAYAQNIGSKGKCHPASFGIGSKGDKCKEVTTPDTDQPLQFALDAVITVVLHVQPGLVWVCSYICLLYTSPSPRD